MASILLNHTELRFPDFTIVSASAGSGKTHTLTLKILQLLLSTRVPNNRLNNVLAMTFTKNAAAEMRQRVLEYLKKAYHGDNALLDQLGPLVSIDRSDLRIRCGELLETILQDYSAFQVQTIDSFMARVFRASALEFGFSPAIEIVLNNAAILNSAFEQFARELASDPSKQKLLEELTDIFVESQSTSSKYIWDPYQKLSGEVRRLYDTLSAQSKDILNSADDGHQLNTLRKEILDAFHELRQMVRNSGLEVSRYFDHAAAAAQNGDADKLIELKSIHKPVKAGKTKEEKEKTEEWNRRFLPILDRFDALAEKYVVTQAYHFYRPSIEAHNLFRDTIDRMMRRSGQVQLPDVNRALRRFISEEIVPQVYFYLGDTIAHYLIDEFQDTAPVQWETLKPLFAEALSKQGSLFVVGDTKQSIYAFRHADWRIMRSAMTDNVFPSAPPHILDLKTNYRSFERILDFDKTVFHKVVPSVVDGDAPRASGLSDFEQEVNERNRHKGYVEVVSFEKDDAQEQQRAKILDIIHDCCGHRGCRYGDITILTPKNEHVVAVSGWLNSAHIRFVSHSSLDIRGRTITGDILALLRFLDSPIDDLAFTTVLCSGTFHRVLAADGVNLPQEELHSFILQARSADRYAPLYAAFRTQYAELWKKYFDELFTVVGYLPMYDLLSDITKHFRLFEIAREEEGTLAKLLEVVKNYEGTGQNTLKDFLASADEDADDTDWNIAVPHGTDAVSVMTIHKAKGLDNRIVIVLLVDSKSRPENLFVDEQADGIRLVRITQKSAEFNARLQELYRLGHEERTVDDLNKLYVALTRAKEELYVICVKSDYADEPSKFLPSTGYEPSERSVGAPASQPIEPIASIYHSPVRMQAGIAPAEKLALHERRRGDFIHEVLSQVNYADSGLELLLASSIRKSSEHWNVTADEAQLKSVMLEFLNSPEMAPWFARAERRTIMNEQEFVHSDGRLFRMDRIIVDPEEVTVIDFKTGDDKESYTEQVRGYMEILGNFYPGRTLRGILAFVDRKKIQVIA